MSERVKTSNALATSLLVGSLLSLLVGERILAQSGLHQVFGYGGWLLLLVSLGLRGRAFATSEGDVRGVELRLLACSLSAAASLLLYVLSTDAGIEAMGLTAAAAERTGGALGALWPALLLVSLFGVLFIELVYVRMPVAASVELRRVRTSMHAGLSLGLSIVFLVSMNYVATKRDVRKDVSYFRTSEPSQGSLRMIEKLDEPLTVVLFFRPASDVLLQLRPYFERLARGNPKLRVEVEDVALAPDLAREHKIRENGHVLLIKEDAAGASDDKPGDKPGEKKADTQDAKKKKAKSEFFRVGTTLTDARRVLRKLDGTFQQSFRKLALPERALHLTVGHGERNARASDLKSADSTGAMVEILRRLNLKSERLGVSEGLGSKIPDGASAVGIIGPSERFMPEEVDTLVSYVQKGGRLLLMLDPDVDVGLDKLLAALGVQQLPGKVTSDTFYMRRTHTQSDRAIIFANSYSSHPSVSTVSRHHREVATIMVEGAAFTRLDDAAKAAAPDGPKPTTSFPLRSGAKFWRDLDHDFKQGPDEKEELLNLIVATSFQAGPGAQKTGDKGADEGRAVVIGDGDFITNKLAGNNGNLLVFVDSLAWLVGNEEIGGDVTSEQDIPIEHSSEEDKVWFYATTFGVPVPVVAVGLMIARRRRRRGEKKA
ncbi:MAG: GldG family protein [Myxococcales bacterium]|nr:GldG family protein [Myxococcales bacterium]